MGKFAGDVKTMALDTQRKVVEKRGTRAAGAHEQNESGEIDGVADETVDQEKARIHSEQGLDQESDKEGMPVAESGEDGQDCGMVLRIAEEALQESGDGEM